MGLSLYLESEKCSKCGRSDNPEFEWNYTYNVSCMWQEVFPGESMVQIDGMTGEQSQSKLEIFCMAMEAHPEKFKAMNPANGWGSYDSFLVACHKLLDAAIEFPACKWSLLITHLSSINITYKISHALAYLEDSKNVILKMADRIRELEKHCDQFWQVPNPRTKLNSNPRWRI